MKWIVITPPQFLPNEATFINLMFTHGLDVLHLRKPHASATDCEQLLQQIDSQWLPQVVVHDHFDLCRQYGLMGVHLNQRNPQPPIQHQGSISRSCHSLSEVKQYSATCQYVTLSPIFNSISKQGYQAAFSQQALTEATQQGIVNDKVIALGGISLGTFRGCMATHQRQKYRQVSVQIATSINLTGMYKNRSAKTINQSFMSLLHLFS